MPNAATYPRDSDARGKINSELPSSSVVRMFRLSLFLVILLAAASVLSDGGDSSSDSEEECPSNYVSGRFDRCEAKCGEKVPYCVHVEMPWLRDECHCRADKGFAVENGDCIPASSAKKK